jgi:Spy/CpxP family protein refolding chaperone
MSEANPTPPPSRRRWIVAGSIIGAVAVLIGATAYVRAQVGWNHGWRGPMSAEVLADRIEMGVKFALSDIDATADQKARVTSILQTAAKDVHGLFGQHASARDQIREILSAPSIDRARLETVRENELRFADEASKRALEGLADAAEVLSPEQRVQLAQQMEEHRKRWHGDRH